MRSGADVVLRLQGPGGSRDLRRAELESLADPTAAQSAGAVGAGLSAVPFRALAGMVPHAPGVTHATFHATDGYAASIALEQALADGLVLVPPESSGKVGVRLVVTQGRTMCLNVKAVERVELTVGPGKHTVNPNPHTPARVHGWDE